MARWLPRKIRSTTPSIKIFQEGSVMSFITTQPEMMTTAASSLSGIGASSYAATEAANAVAAG